MQDRRSPDRGRRRRHVHRPHLRHPRRLGGARQDAHHPRRPVDRRDDRAGAAGRALRDRSRRRSAPAIDTVVHGTTTADNTMIEQDGAAVGLLVTEGHRDEIEMRRVHKEQIWDPSYPAPFPIARRRSRIPDARARRLPGRGAAGPRRGGGARRGATLRQLGAESLAVDVPVQLRQPRPRAPGARDHPRGVPRGGPHLAEPRGHATRPRVRAHVDHAGQRLRGAAGVELRQPARPAPPRRRVSRRAADHGVDRRRDAPGHGGAPGGLAARLGTDRRRHGSSRGRGRPGRDRPTSSRSTWAAPASTSAWSAAAMPEIRTRLELAVPVLHRDADGRRAVRRRRWRLDRPRPAGFAAGRPRVGGLEPGSGLLRPRRRAGHRHRRRRRARLPAGGPLRRTAG